MRHMFQYLLAQPFAELNHPFLMAGGAKVATLTGKRKQIFMPAVFAFHTGKTVVQIPAIEIAIDHLLDIWPPEAVLPEERSWFW